MKRFLFLALFVIVSFPTLGQIEHGSIAVVYLTNDKIITAADSRGVLSGSGIPPDDSACKIVAPDGRMIFASTGSVGYKNGGSNDFVQSWSNTEEIRRAYSTSSRLYSTNLDRIMGAANEWGRLISWHYQSLILWHPEMVAEKARKEHGVLTVGLFGGLGDDGTLILFQTDVTYQEGFLATASPNTRQVTCPKSYCAIGEVAIVDEFVNLTSERAKEEAQNWKPPKKSDPKDYDILKTVRLVELTIQYHDDDVGGSVDAAQLDKNGRVHWFAIKKNCAKD